MTVNESVDKFNTEINVAMGNLYTNPLLKDLPVGSWQVSPSFSDNVLSLAIVINYEILSLHHFWEIQDYGLFLNAIGKEFATSIFRYRLATLATDTIHPFLVKFSINDSNGNEQKLSCKSRVLIGALLEQSLNHLWGIMTILDDDNDEN
jgi:hypothetical protein